MKYGKYEIDRELGRGACGITYLAHDPDLQREVALKLLVVPHTLQGPARSDHLQRFLREARAASAIRHPGVPAIYEVGAEGEDYFIAMEFCPGQTLREVLADRGSLPFEQSLRIVQQVLEVLQQAHSQGIFHRDIKPDNLMLSPDEQSVQVMDFGIARAVGDVTLTSTGATVGTPSYMSPEQALGNPIDGRSDLFSVAILLHELVTGTRPFAGTSLPQLLHAVAYGEPQIDPSLPEALAQVLRVGLAKEPNDRFADAGQMRIALEAVAGAPNHTQLLQIPPAPPSAAPGSPPSPGVGGPTPFSAAGSAQLNPFGPLHPGGVAVPTHAAPSGPLPGQGGAVGALATQPGNWRQDLLHSREGRQFAAAVGAFVIAAVALGIVYFGQQNSRQSTASVRLPPYRASAARRNSIQTPTAVARGMAPAAGGFGQIPGSSYNPYASGSQSRPAGGRPPGPPTSWGADSADEAASATRPPSTSRKRNAERPDLYAMGGPVTTFRTEDPLPEAASARRNAGVGASPQASPRGNRPTRPLAVNPGLPPNELNGVPAEPSSTPEPAARTAPEPVVPRSSPPLAQTAPLSVPDVPAPGTPLPAARRSAPRPVNPPRTNRRSRVHGGDREVYTITGEEALNYGIRTTKRIPNPDRYGFWYQTISPTEAWDRYRVRYQNPIPDPDLYGPPPVPLRKLPQPGDLLSGG